MSEQQTLDALFRTALADTAAAEQKAGVIPVGASVDVASVLAAVRAQQGPHKPSGHGWPVSTLAARWVVDDLRGRRHTAVLWHEQGDSLRVFTDAPQDTVERILGYADDRLKRERKQRAEEIAKTKPVRYCVRCRYCKKKWTEQFSYQTVARLEHTMGLRHECPKISEWRKRIDELTAKAMERGKVPAEQREKWWMATWRNEFERVFYAEPVRWKNTGAPTKCGSRCINATGPNCDCRCRGEHHGEGAAG